MTTGPGRVLAAAAHLKLMEQHEGFAYLGIPAPLVVCVSGLEEHIGAAQVSMDNAKLVQVLQAAGNIQGNGKDSILHNNSMLQLHTVSNTRRLVVPQIVTMGFTNSHVTILCES